MHEPQGFHTLVSDVAFWELAKAADLLGMVVSRCHDFRWQKPLFRLQRQDVHYVSLLKGSFRRRLALKMTLHSLSLPPQAIYEMSRGEQDLIEDLKLARKVSGVISCSQCGQQE